MANIFDLCIVGSGVAGSFATTRIAEKHKDLKTLTIELGAKYGKRRQQSFGFLGLMPNSDGKLYVDDLDKVKELTDGRRIRNANTWVMDKLKEAAGNLKVTKDSTPSVAAQKRIKESGFELQTNDYIQWRPESVHTLSRNMAVEVENNPNITYSFENEVYKISKKRNQFHISTYDGEFIAKRVLLATGIAGWRWATKLYQELGLVVSDDYARIGVRLEISGNYLKDFNKSHCTLTKNEIKVGKFSWGGQVIPIDHTDSIDHTDLAVSGFRGNEDRWKSERVSMSLISNRHFPGQGTYECERLAKLAFLLYNDRVGKEKIRTIFNGTSQLSMLPEYDWLKESITELDKIIPNLKSKGSFHAPNIEPRSAKIIVNSNLETELEGLFVAGETTGTSGLLFSAISGTVAADSTCF